MKRVFIIATSLLLMSTALGQNSTQRGRLENMFTPWLPTVSTDVWAEAPTHSVPPPTSHDSGATWG